MRVLTLLILTATLAFLGFTEDMTLTYIVRHEVDQADNYVKVDLTLTVEGNSLQDCIIDAREIINEMKKLSIKTCKKSAKSSS